MWQVTEYHTTHSDGLRPVYPVDAFFHTEILWLRLTLVVKDITPVVLWVGLAVDRNFSLLALRIAQISPGSVKSASLSEFTIHPISNFTTNRRLLTSDNYRVALENDIRDNVCIVLADNIKTKVV